MMKSLKKVSSFKRILVVALSFALTFSTFACKPKNGKGVSAEVWTAYGTEKILKEFDYSSRYADKTLKIGAFRNEYESGQIIISADGDAEYKVELSALKSASGKELPVSSFDVYHQKYVNVTTVKEPTSSTGAGYYPDPLLPYEKAVEYKENFVEGGNNQGVWVEVNPSKEQDAGLYTGAFKVTVGNAEYSVPVEVTVYDYTLSDEVHMKTKFNANDADIMVSELDATPEMFFEYADFLTEYRISGSRPLWVWVNDTDRYFSYVEKMHDNPKCTVIPILYTGSATVIELDTDGYLAIDGKRGADGNTKTSVATLDWASCSSLMMKFVSHSLQSGKNLFRKASLYMNIIDEYDSSTGLMGLNKATYNLRRCSDMYAKIADLTDSLEWTDKGIVNSKELKFATENDNGGFGYYLENAAEAEIYKCFLSESEFYTLKEQMKESLLAVTNTTTATGIADFIYENQNFASFCPTIDYYGAESNRARSKAYAEKSGTEIWTYTAVNPVGPYPTYHTEDALISSRLLGWMMYEYDIVGNLYWGAMVSRATDNDDAQLVGQDYFDEPLRYPGANGDGYILYPGRPYGIDGPVGSVRLHSIRDSIEDYDLMYELENNYYAKRGASGDGFDSIMKLFTENLYTGTRCDYSGDYLSRFATARGILADLLNLAENYGTVIESYKFESGMAKFKVSAPSDASLKVNGNAVSGNDENGIVKYNIEFELNKDENEFALSVAENGRESGVVISLGGRTAAVVTDELEGKITISTNESHDKETYIGEQDGISLLYMNFAAEGKTSAQAEWNAGALNINADYSRLTFTVYCSSDNVRLTVKGKTTSGAAYISLEPVELVNGWNEISVNLAQFRLSGNAKLDMMRLTAEPIGTAFAEDFTLGIGEIVLKGE